MKQLVRSTILSIVASIAATYLLRQLITGAVSGSEDEASAADGGTGPGNSVNVNVNVVVMPIIIGNMGMGAPWALRRLKGMQGMKGLKGPRRWR